MEINEQIGITLERVKKALNQRYEKDADMYISYQDLLVIKELLYKREYGAINNMIAANKVSPVVAARVIIRNLWLLNAVTKDDIKRLNSLLEQCDVKTLREIADGIEQNEIEIPRSLKVSVLKIYYGKAPLADCLKYLKNTDRLQSEILKVCFVGVVNQTAGVQKKMAYIKEFSKLHADLNDPQLMVTIVEALPEKQIAQFKMLLIAEITDSISKQQEAANLFVKALFMCPGRVDSFKMVIERVNGLLCLGNGYTKPVCSFMRDFLKKLDDSEAEEGVNQVFEIYNAIDPDKYYITSPIENKVFAAQGYSKPVREALNKRMSSEGVEVDSAKTERPKNADDVYKGIRNNPCNGMKWYSWILGKYIYPFQQKKGSILIGFLKKYGGECSCDNHYVSLFKTLGEEIRDTDSVISDLFSFLHKLEDGKLDNDTSWDVERNKNGALMCLHNFRDAILRRNIKQGGEKGAIYSYLYYHNYNECLRLFDI